MAYQSIEIAQLRAKQEALDKELAEAKERETRQVMIEIVQKMREYGISLNELMGRKSGTPPDEPRPKYRDPATGSTWSGRGRVPAWILGKDRGEFQVDKQAAARAMVQAALLSDGH
ncbi:histidine biosynthesis protein [Caballeronia jiangsuensis]|nr:histidine biosynthesis protein [Caballeronia jiangsuensis]